MRIKKAALVALSLTPLTLVTLSPLTSFALSEAHAEFFATNNGNNIINWWDPDACEPGSTGALGSQSGATGTLGGTSTGGFSLDEVISFASQPIGSTWNIDDSAAESWFLASGTAAINHFGLNSSNIGEITAAVKAAGVSPAFFYAYTVNEGGGAGGFINHFANDAPGGAVANATHDAEYLSTQSQVTNGTPATGGGEPLDMPTAEAAALLQSLPAGSIGVIYIQATSAVTAEIEDLYGKTGGWTGLFNKPLQGVMAAIKSMGGDPMVSGSAVTPGLVGSISSNCSTATAGVAGDGIQKAVNWAIMIAGNDGYGYSQASRQTGWDTYQSNPECTGSCGYFDCSSFVASALTYAGYYSTNPFFNTMSEGESLSGIGFTDITSSIDLATGSGLQSGDVLLSSGHTGLYVGNGQVAEAMNESMGIVVDNYTGGFTQVWRAPN